MTVGTEEFSRHARSGVSQLDTLFLQWRCGSGQNYIRFSSSLLGQATAVVLTIARFFIQNPPVDIRLSSSGLGCPGGPGGRLSAKLNTFVSSLLCAVIVQYTLFYLTPSGLLTLCRFFAAF